jgi:release factor glutamine methyltransferase
MAQSAGAKPDWTIGGLLQWTEQFFAGKGVESPRLEAQILLAHALGCERIQLYTRFDEPAADPARTSFRELVRRRVEGCPVAYLVGRKEFYKLSFEVTPAVLIPRPATETLVVAALERAKPLAAPRVLDVGTGSGCIAVSVASQHRGATVVAVDTSAEALDLARRNADRHGVAERIDLRQGELFAPVAGEPPFDLVLSNPPYIPTADCERLTPDVRDHEPRAALDGGPDGLVVFDRLIAAAPAHLAPGGWLLIEIGAGQDQEARSRLAQVPGLTVGPTRSDHEGQPRVVCAQKTAG